MGCSLVKSAKDPKEDLNSAIKAACLTRNKVDSFPWFMDQRTVYLSHTTAGQSPEQRTCTCKGIVLIVGTLRYLKT